MENRKLQVFVSSTFTDMRDERQAAVEAILEARHIPAGMELFAANNESQWRTINKWIDDSSVFLLVLGGRYGTMDSTRKKSYIEMEFRYAERKKKELCVFLMSEDYLRKKEKQFLKAIKNSEEILKWNELEHCEELKKFREYVRNGRIAPECKSLEQLKHEILKSFQGISEKCDLAGWIPDTHESKYVLAKGVMGINLRGIPVAESVIKAGLTDIENRSIDENQLPPKEIYSSVQEEVLISGLTLKYTIDHHQEYIEKLLDDRKKVFLLMLDPKSKGAKIIESLHAKRGIQVIKEAKGVEEAIRTLGYLKRRNFSLRFYDRIPPFTGILIDGNAASSKKSNDDNGIVRVQPRTAFGIQHKGIIFQFKKIRESEMDSFEFFASDLRMQWKKAEIRTEIRVRLA